MCVRGRGRALRSGGALPPDCGQSWFVDRLGGGCRASSSPAVVLAAEGSVLLGAPDPLGGLSTPLSTFLVMARIDCCAAAAATVSRWARAVGRCVGRVRAPSAGGEVTATRMRRDDRPGQPGHHLDRPCRSWSRPTASNGRASPRAGVAWQVGLVHLVASLRTAAPWLATGRGPRPRVAARSAHASMTRSRAQVDARPTSTGQSRAVSHPRDPRERSVPSGARA